jgi:DNA-binding SARP family transcriptional activator
MGLSLTLLGGFQARIGSGPVLRLRTRHTQALLAYLALPSGMAQPRDKLAALLWGHLAQDEARNRLRQSLFALRRALAPAHLSCLSVDGDALVLGPAGVEVDALVFEELVREGSPDALERAAILYHGDLLQGLPAQGPHPSAFEEWLGGERERLRELALEALAKLVNVQRAAGSPERALSTALRLLALDPLQEAAHRTAMRLHVRLGRRTAALRQYQACVNSLRRELNVEPEEETRQLYRDVLRRRPILAATGPVPRTAGWAPAASPSDDDIPLIGRELETDRLRAWLAKASSGSCQVALLVGETGAGKSRLVAELVAEALAADAELRPRPVRMLLGRCHEGEQILAFGPWIDAFRAGRLPEDRALLDRLEPVWRAELVRLLPELEGSEVPVSPDPPDAPRLFEGVRQLVACLINRSPVVLILEDLHWADEMSLRLLQFLAHRASGWPLLLVGTVREEELPDLPFLRQTLESLEGEPHVERVRVAPLSPRATVQLVRALSSTASEPTALERIGEEVWRASEGNPFVVIETMRALQQGISLAGPGGLALVERVRRVIARRLDRLSERARELAAVGAVIGRGFEFSLLQGAAGVDEVATAASVEELVRRQVLHEVAGGLDFVHERLRGVVYAELLGPRRRLLHRQVAEALEALHSGDLDPHSLAIGIHYREGEVWEKAAAHFARAGLRALGRSATVESVTCFEQALDAVNRLPETDNAVGQAIDVRIALRYPLAHLGRVARFGALLEEAELMAFRLGDRRRQALAASGRCHYLYSIGNNERASEAGERAMTIARGLQDRELEGEATYYAGLPLMALGRYREASRPLGALVDSLEGETRAGRPHRWGSGHALACAFLARCLAEIGEFAEALAFGERGLARAEKFGNPLHVTSSCLGLGSAYLRKGDFTNAISQLGRGLALIEAHEINVFLPATSACLGLALAWSGQTTEGLALLDRALRRSRSMNISAGCAKWMAYRSEAHLLSEQVPEARQWAEAALLHAREHGERGHEALALRLLGDVSARTGAPGLRQAELLYEEALALASGLEMRPLSALCHLNLGVLLQERNRPEKAGRHLAQSVGTLKQMDMGFWLRSATDHLGRLHEPAT